MGDKVTIEPLTVIAEIQGFLHQPGAPSGDGLVLTHGAGGNAQAPLLVAVAAAFAARGVIVLRCDLPYRQSRRFGPPSPAAAGRDRAGLAHAVQVMRGLAGGRVFLGGMSYGGRQASILASEDRAVADALLLLSYPLHPPGRPTELRTAHFPRLWTPTLFVRGTADPFGAAEELEAARKLIPAHTELLVVHGGHDLRASRSARASADLADRVVDAFSRLIG